MSWQHLVSAVYPELISIRRLLHQYPELGFQEYNTAELITAFLRRYHLAPQTGIAKTGISVMISGNSPKTIAIRSDMDALPIQEQCNKAYASKIPGVMHACGHDGHIAIALGAAAVLSQLPLPGNIQLIFQPAEEGPGGALPLIEAGVLDPHVTAALGFHLTNQLQLGQIGYSYGPTCASTDEVHISIFGKGGHGAHPHQAVDAVVIAAQAICALQTIVSRKIDPLESAVLTFGEISGGYANNVIADLVKLTGTLRTFNSELRHSLPACIDQILSGITKANGAAYQLQLLPGYPPLFTDKKITLTAAEAAAKVIGKNHVILVPPSMGGEDFAYFAQKVPAAFIRIGSGTASFSHPGHHPSFDFAEQAIAIGVKVVVQTILDYLA